MNLNNFKQECECVWMLYALNPFLHLVSFHWSSLVMFKLCTFARRTCAKLLIMLYNMNIFFYKLLPYDNFGLFRLHKLVQCELYLGFSMQNVYTKVCHAIVYSCQCLLIVEQKTSIPLSVFYWSCFPSPFFVNFWT